MCRGPATETYKKTTNGHLKTIDRFGFRALSSPKYHRELIVFLGVRLRRYRLTPVFVGNQLYAGRIPTRVFKNRERPSVVELPTLRASTAPMCNPLYHCRGGLEPMGWLAPGLGSIRCNASLRRSYRYEPAPQDAGHNESHLSHRAWPI